MAISPDPPRSYSLVLGRKYLLFTKSGFAGRIPPRVRGFCLFRRFTSGRRPQTSRSGASRTTGFSSKEC
jgi:hypothetical protein